MLTLMYHQLREHFGPPINWWPIFGDDEPFEILLGAVLVQQTRWEAVEGAVLRLRDSGLLAPQHLAAADTAVLAALLRPVAFHTQKAAGVIAICRYLCQHYAGSVAALLAQPTAPLRRELLALPRIGPETADVILLYAGGHQVFVVDDYTRRLMGRVYAGTADAEGQQRADAGRFDWQRARYNAVQQRIEGELEPPESEQAGAQVVALYAEYHALINEECVRYCVARNPRCDGPPARRVYSIQEGRESYQNRQDGCPLRQVCRYYQLRA